MTSPYRQAGYALRLDWGPTGAAEIASEVDVAVVVDVLSFTTTLTVAADRGTVVHPYRWRDESAVRFAADHDAVLAGGRSQGGVSLSPATIRAAADLPRLVLPSPNGSTISALLADAVPLVAGVSLRNRAAAAAWLRRRRAENPDLRVAVVAAGERWPDGSLRPAVEDLWGAGGLLSVLIREGWTASPEARAAAAAFDAVGADVETALHDCASGRELDGIGFANDVDTAAELDASASVPLLVDGRFVSARS
ncbi:2-phosphosulfolactate phosphatase [Pseudonocardia sp. WMMC193]|uniref:2-phosphosulfolactate phosphatase n=1 Tax=Pseudonocardia sp. WMMC193 TaxID=2911965 RepID=UPI001F007013|nr:2-phosphosulfolactate phosphatase [Pseudonocardia sp. WMMC193]MCF7549602.1 2-phosphosulfolactate phosphatase [Pseudonocardia sp. WMMC193]